MQENNSEIERIKEVFDKRKKVVPSQRYSFFDIAYLFLAQRRELEILKAFIRFKITSLEGKKYWILVAEPERNR